MAPFPMTARDLIPGAYDRSTLTRRQPGSMGRSADEPPLRPDAAGSMDSATIAEHEKEGGGGLGQRPRRRHDV